MPWLSKGAGFVGNGCVGDVFSPGTVDCGTGRSTIGQIGSPVSRSSTKTKPCLVIWASSLRGLPSTTTSMRVGAAGRS
jgi:hypothetical protein